MYITKIHIDKFGSLADRELTLSCGLNIIEGENESGKSTLSRFIKYIFYGFSDKAERERSIGFCDDFTGGFIEFCTEGGRAYRAERTTTAGGRDKTSVTDCESGAPLDGGEAWEIFFGVPATVFEHTAFVGQAGGGKVGGAAVDEAIENILFSADEGVNTGRALKKLEDSRVLLRHKKGRGGRIPELEDEIEALGARLTEAQEAAGGIISREGSIRDNRTKYDENEATLNALYGKREYYRTGELEGRRRKIKEHLKRAADLEAEREEIIKKASNGSFIPDAEYLSALKTSAAALLAAEGDKASCDAALARAEAEQPEGADFLRRAAIAEQNGGRDGVVDKIRLCRAKQKTELLRSLLFFVLAAAAASAAFIYRTETAIFAAALIVALGIAGAAVLSVLSLSKAKKTADDLLSVLGISEGDNLAGEIDRAISAKAAAKEHEERVRELSAAAKMREGDLSRAVRESERLLSLWDRSSLASATDEAETLLLSLDENKNKTEQCRAAAKAAAEQMTVGNEELDRLIAALGVTDEGMAALNIKDIERDIKFSEGRRSSLDEQYNNYERELAVLRATVADPVTLASQLAAAKKEHSALSEKYDALVLARDSLTEATEGLRDTISPRLSREAGKYLGEMTGGKYDSLGIDSRLEMSFSPDGGGVRGSDYMSAGTADLAYLSLRLALTALLFRAETPPLVFDESFARIDDARLRRILTCLATLSDDGIQSIVLTSGSREGKIGERTAFKL